MSELREFLAAHYLPSRMVLAGVNVDHQQLVGLAREHFLAPRTSWERVESTRGVDKSISQYNPNEVKVRHVFVCMFVCMFLCGPVCAFASMYVCTHVCVCVCMHVCACACMYIYVILYSLRGVVLPWLGPTPSLS